MEGPRGGDGGGSVARHPDHGISPLSIKQAVTGNGQASKEQVANMLRYILKIPPERMPNLLDATDALAAALTHYYETGKPKVEKGAKSWEQFLKQNPDRIAPRRK